MNELREEIELPPIEDTFGLGMVPPMEALRQREAQLKSSLAANRGLQTMLNVRTIEIKNAEEENDQLSAANREQKAEIERLKEELGKFHEHPHVNKEYGTCPISDVRLAEMCQETKWWKHDDDEIYRVVHELKDSRASLRASVGEKWKPIESAPKDQSVFLGRKGNIIYMTQSCKCYVKWPHQEGGPTFRDEWNMIEYDAVSPWSPTHWAEIEPLPVAPTLPGEEK